MPFPEFSRPPSLRTGRLLLRPLSPADAAAIEPLVSDWGVARHTASIPHPYPAGEAERWIGRALDEQAEGGGLVLLIEEGASGRIVGCIGLETEDSEERLEVGYWVGRPFWGRGYATEAARALVAWAFSLPRVREVHASVFTDNPASARVLEKAGFRRVGRGMHPAPARGGDKEVLLFSIRRKAEGPPGMLE